MGRLIIIIEHSGEGKRYIIDNFRNRSTLNTILIKKYATRVSRDLENITDLVFDSQEEIKKCTYTYEYRNYYYGIKKEDIDFALENNNNPVIFVTNTQIIINLKKDFPNALTVHILDMVFNSGSQVDDDFLYKVQEDRFSMAVEYTRRKIYNYCIVNSFDEMFLQQLNYILEYELNKKELKDGVTVFLSYNWNDKDIVDKVDNYLSQKENITVIRDVRNIGLWGRIKEFMKTIRDKDYAVLFISEMYLKSSNCMYEILELMKVKEYEKRIFPVVLNKSIYNPLVRLEYIKYWQNRYDELENLISSLHISNLGEILDELKRYKLILNSIDDFLSVIIDMNNPQVENIEETIYEAIFNG